MFSIHFSRGHSLQDAINYAEREVTRLELIKEKGGEPPKAEVQGLTINDCDRLMKMFQTFVDVGTRLSKKKLK